MAPGKVGPNGGSDCPVEPTAIVVILHPRAAVHASRALQQELCAFIRATSLAGWFVFFLRSSLAMDDRLSWSSHHPPAVKLSVSQRFRTWISVSGLLEDA